MATFLETGLLDTFSIIFPALLVLIVSYAILAKFKILGDNMTINSLVAVALAFLTIISKEVTALISFMAPWFVLAFIFLLLMLLFWKIMGASDESITNYLMNDKAINWVLFGVG